MSANLAAYIVRKRKYGGRDPSAITNDKSSAAVPDKVDTPAPKPITRTNTLQPKEEAKVSHDTNKPKATSVKPAPENQPKTIKVEPKPKLEPKPEVTAKVEPKPKLTNKVEPKPAVVPKVEPKSAIVPKVESKPLVVPKAEPKTNLAPKIAKKPEIISKAELSQIPTSEITPKPTIAPATKPQEIAQKVKPTPEVQVPNLSSIHQPVPAVSQGNNLDKNKVSNMKKNLPVIDPDFFLNDGFVFGGNPRVNALKIQNCTKGPEFAKFFSWLTNGREDDMYEAYNILFGRGSL